MKFKIGDKVIITIADIYFKNKVWEIIDINKSYDGRIFYGYRLKHDNNVFNTHDEFLELYNEK